MVPSETPGPPAGPFRARLIREVAGTVGGPPPARCARVVGRVERCDLQQGRAVLEDRGWRLMVDVTTIATPVHGGIAAVLKDGNVVQVLGELVQAPASQQVLGQVGGACPPLLLRAWSTQALEGLNMDLYECCLRARREFELRHCPENV
eukprot:CAMPEP_0172876240 /NCGR_PEP_ID=MMETSP1075-20121228/103808_1 /TAXON_ID=2916 /ORGANISM="Ceratium fusus, Strain PA161109" /LENGTH=148 /DNA_ID=CAMNT_0013727517 /DNA_START=8 /DNA_END=454 /DNA_ORIENTATION=+